MSANKYVFICSLKERIKKPSTIMPIYPKIRSSPMYLREKHLDHVHQLLQGCCNQILEGMPMEDSPRMKPMDNGM